MSFALLATVFPAPATAAPTRAEYIAAVDPICQEANRDIKNILRGYGNAYDSGKLKKAGRLLLRAARRYEVSIADVEAIEPPTEDAQLIAQWLGLHKEVATVRRKAAGALKRKDRAAFRRLGDKEVRLFKEIKSLISGYGFQHCA